MFVKRNQPLLSIIIPIYNEEKIIFQTFYSLRNYFEKQNFSLEYIFVDDCSLDKSYKILQTLQGKYNQIILLQNRKNQGKGETIKKGVIFARGRYILFSDADLSAPIGEFDKFLPLLGKYDILAGSRRIKGSKIPKPQPILRRLFGILFYLLLDVFFQLPVRDTNCGFKCFKSKVAKEIFKRQRIKRWGFDVETFYIAKLWKFSVKEVPVVWYDRSGSKVRLFSAIFNTLIELIQIKINSLKGIYR